MAINLHFKMTLPRRSKEQWLLQPSKKRTNKAVTLQHLKMDFGPQQLIIVTDGPQACENPANESPNGWTQGQKPLCLGAKRAQ